MITNGHEESMTTIWGKIIGGTAGFALGGPIGGLLGALAGHAVDSYASDSRPDPSGREVAFTIALIALSAKMAKADGIVSRDEILAFRQKVDISAKDIDHVGQLWDLARQTPDGFDGYARQLAEMFPKASPVLDQLMELLFFIAQADGAITPNEEEYLSHVARILGYDAAGYARLKQIHGDPNANPYAILGVDYGDDDTAIRNRWIALVRHHHPDRLMADGLPEEFIRTANERLASINAAYEEIRTLRDSRKGSAQLEEPPHG
jgi:DnaJ like chaperone protein